MPTGLVWLTVVAVDRREDLAVSGDVPVAELVPALATRLRALDLAATERGLQLITADGCPLDPGRSLRDQGIASGALLVLDRPSADDAPWAYDDPAEAVAKVIDEEIPPWTTVLGQRVGEVAAGVLVVVGLVPAVLLRPTSASAVVAASVAVGLAASCVWGSRRSTCTAVCLATGWAATAYAVVAGWLAAPAGTGRPGVVALAGGAGAAVALILHLGTPCRRAGTLGPAVAAGVVTVAASAAAVLPVPIPPMLVCCQLLAVGVSALAPRWAVSLAGRLHDSATDPSPTRSAPPSPPRVRPGTVSAHRLLLDLWVGAGLILVVTAPPLVAAGPWGAGLAVACSLSMLLGARRHRSAAAVLVGGGSGAGGLLATAGAAMVLLPEVRVLTAAALPAVGLGVVGVGRLPALLLARLADLADIALLVFLPGLAVLAAGGLTLVQR